jgi:phosphoglycerol transferase MdoB-like AlkP superfamily enzyme
MRKYFRVEEYKILAFRLFLAYVFYGIARIFFTIYNFELLGSPGLFEFLRLYYHGLIFDTAGILYVNMIFILFSILPLSINTWNIFQKFQFFIYFLFNLTAYATNFIDFIYFKYILTRSTLASFESIQHESNKVILLFSFIMSYWHVFFLFIVLSIIWVYLYRLWNLKNKKPQNPFAYYGLSIVCFFVIIILMVGAIRGGDFKKSTRPINMVDANRHVNSSIQAGIVLNTPFCIIRTINKKSVKKVEYLSDEEVIQLVKPIKQYDRKVHEKPNVVLIIIESYGREYSGAFNPETKIKDYKSYTPFVDSLAQHSLIFTNAYANGYKSIHGMSSILSGIPSFKDAFTSTPYANQKIESLVSVLENLGYHTSFFHGAENGSMGFLGYSNILGIDKYFGRNEYNNDTDFDGYWGIWDEPFLQFMKEKLDEEKEPFFSTVFTISSHEPYIIPEKYKETFPEGDIIMHKCVRYTDYALRRFFDEAKKEHWYNNTLFVLVADHANLIYYPEYRKALNINTIPILFYHPDGRYNGINNLLAQQIDIYPTIVNMIGFNKPFRSWGRSLISDQEEPFVVRYSGYYYYFYDKYVCCFDGEKLIGFYELSDKSMKNNLINENKEMMFLMEKRCKAFIQDYMNKIIDSKLSENRF